MAISLAKCNPEASTDIAAADIPIKKSCRRENTPSSCSFEILINGLKEITKKYEKSCKSVIKIVKADPRTKFKTHFCVTAMPEFMERVHELDFSNRVIFLDGTGNANRFNCSVFVLMVDSHVGALPFGFFITSYRSANLLEHTFNALAEIKPTNAFSTPSFPLVVITGVDQAEHTAVTKCFHSVKAYIGTFHLLRAVWCFIWDPENDIALDDRSQLFMLFKDVVLSQSEEQLNNLIWICKESATSKKYPHFLKYFNNLLKKKDLWGLDFRVRNNISYNKNILTSEMHVLKENVLHSWKILSVTELFEYLCTKFCDYYVRKITEAACGHLRVLLEFRYLQSDWSDADDVLVCDADCKEEILVINSKKRSQFYVNRKLGICTCIVGKYGSPCVHQMAVAKKLKSELFTIASMNLEEKGKYCYLATGLQCVLDQPNIVLENLLRIGDKPNMAFDVLHQNGDQPNNSLNELYQNNVKIDKDDSIADYVTEYVVVTNPDDVCDTVVKIEHNYSSEDCVQAMEIFWSKLSPYTRDHPNEIYQWIDQMNQQLSKTSNFDDVLKVLGAKTCR